MSLADRIEATYAPSAPREELIEHARRLEQERDAFYAILSLQQTVNDLKERIDAVDPEPDLEQRIRDKIMEIQAAVPFVPGEGYATGYHDGVHDATADLIDVVDGVE